MGILGFCHDFWFLLTKVMDIFLSEMPQWRRNKRQFGAAQCLTLGGKGRVLLRLINNPEVTGSLGRLGLLEVATQCDVELGRDYAMEQRSLVSRGSV